VSCQLSKHNLPRVRKVVVLVLALVNVARHRLTFHLQTARGKNAYNYNSIPLLSDFKTDAVQCANSSIKILYVTKPEVVSRNFYKACSKSIMFPSQVQYGSAARKNDFLLTNQTV